MNLIMRISELEENINQNTEDLREMQRKRLPLLTGDYKKKKFSYDQ